MTIRKMRHPEMKEIKPTEKDHLKKLSLLSNVKILVFIKSARGAQE